MKLRKVFLYAEFDEDKGSVDSILSNMNELEAPFYLSSFREATGTKSYSDITKELLVLSDQLKKTPAFMKGVKRKILDRMTALFWVIRESLNKKAKKTVPETLKL
jgi:hypothetical protein